MITPTDSATTSGLTSEEARRRFAATGPNEITTTRRHAGLRQIGALLANPLGLILLGASAVSAVLGEAFSASLIALMVVLSVALNFVQTFRSERAAERLRDTVAPTATAVRDGVTVEIPRREVVPGDLIRLAAGDRVPADARLVDGRDLHVQQAALTGESMPVEKSPGAADDGGGVYLGTSVVSGTATAVVTATGPATAFGDVAARLAIRRLETEFERGTKRFALFIMRTIVLLVLFVLLASAALGRPFLESLLFAVALAVGLTPEFLPMITAVTLSKGAVHMARRKVIVKHLAAIEDFGSLDILCSDKTGTLTSGVVTFNRCVDPIGQPSETPFMFVYLNSAYETGIQNPLDRAVLDHPHPAIDGYKKLDEVPFDFERRCISVVVETPKGGRLLITKGAPESVVPRCTAYEVGGARVPLDETARAHCGTTYEALSEGGERVLAIAYREIDTRPAYARADEQDLVLAGFAVFNDPPMPGVREALTAMARDGVTVKLVTGDNERVARHVCGEVGLDATHIILGAQIEQMTDPALAAVVERTHVFARVSPGQKNRIIIALKSRNHVVGYLGDGINDAPSLHAADVGISVANAVDVAKDAADIILLEPSLAMLHEGILEGRRAFGNVMKYLLMGTSSNFGNMFSMAAGIVFLPFLPMLPLQILLNNFLYDLAQVTIPTDNVDDSFVMKPQRWDIAVIRKFMLVIGPISSVYDFATFIALLRLFHAGEAEFHTGWFVESLATQTLVLFVIRTAGNPLRSRPSLALTATTLLIVAVAVALPFMPFAAALGFVPLPAPFFVFLTLVTVTYLAVVEVVKRWLLRPQALLAASAAHV